MKNVPVIAYKSHRRIPWKQQKKLIGNAKNVLKSQSQWVAVREKGQRVNSCDCAIVD